ncbi:hypothetical protein SFC88_14485 [Nocardioides sp. HM23]|uniref:hypothetical protein n=1 Tax=Nocardioides bizhenqiangii TaxID=3095076 RepID=UPI002ACA71F4|nr:hypothetical protein [Nocardioides sp. HM23]MDZ5622051.1 hypothetical protein [Nocardioides sp. HM23]
MPAQDDARERQMIDRFNLIVPEGRGRSDVDAYLRMADIDEPLPFELKSTTKNSVSTVRDFGPEHITKWRHLHWLFALYDSSGIRMLQCYYASPADMRRWIEDKEAYVRPDMLLAERALQTLDMRIVDDVFGDAETFSIDKAQSIMKRQWSVAEYKRRADLDGDRFSRTAMLEVLRARLGYVIRRGATLNNPHIPVTYFEEVGLQAITEDHAATLRRLVQDYLDSGVPGAGLDPVIAAQANAAATDDATA